MWKSLTGDEREYMNMACKLDAEHREKYPNYVYCLNVARTQKALRAEARDRKRRTVQSRKMNTAPSNTNFSQQASQEQQVRVKIFYEIIYPEDARVACILPKPGPS
jgi:hypothetical protein